MRSIRRLLLVGLIGVMTLVMIVAGAFSYRAGLQEAGEMFDAKLAHSSRVLMSLVDEPLGDVAVHDNGAPIVVAVWQGSADGVGDTASFKYPASITFGKVAGKDLLWVGEGFGASSKIRVVQDW